MSFLYYTQIKNILFQILSTYSVINMDESEKVDALLRAYTDGGLAGFEELLATIDVDLNADDSDGLSLMNSASHGGWIDLIVNLKGKMVFTFLV